MCGIVAAISQKMVAKDLLKALQNLEYRGYDSAGLGILDKTFEIKRLRVVGKVIDLQKKFELHPFDGNLGIAHTRWATHGSPTEKNAHPFISHNIFALVHNGIIENSDDIKNKLIAADYKFESDTDTEVIVHLLHFLYQKYQNIHPTLHALKQELKGSYALAIIFSKQPKHLYGIRNNSPLIVGLSKDTNYIASDSCAINSLCNKYIYLNNGEFADITADKVEIYDQHNRLKRPHTHNVHKEASTSTDKSGYKHYMYKEIMEQPDAIHRCLIKSLVNNHIRDDLFGKKSKTILSKVREMQFVACGTSFYAACIGKYWLEELSNVAAQVEIASEYRYHNHVVNKNTLFVALSQSGETADTLAALQYAKKQAYLSTLGICNVATSSLVRESNLHFITQAGVEIGVASTKAFITQLCALMLLVLTQGERRRIKADIELIKEFENLPNYLDEVISTESEIKIWAKRLKSKSNALFLGRGLLAPIAYEGALKMKEISYIHAEAYPAGELKHGPLALVDSNLPLIVLAPSNYLFEKMLTNIKEVHARKGELFILTDNEAPINRLSDLTQHIIQLPKIHPMLTPFLYILPLQLLAYHIALLCGHNVDQPRNLAKSVTVE